MNDHKWAVLRAWRELGQPDRLLGSGRGRLLGGPLVGWRVRKLLKEAVLLAGMEYNRASEKAWGAQWWVDFIERPVDDAMMESLRKSVPRRPAEREADYTSRLRKVEDAYRSRLPQYPVHARSDGRDRGWV
jgi:hypothetical protein